MSKKAMPWLPAMDHLIEAAKFARMGKTEQAAINLMAAVEHPTAKMTLAVLEASNSAAFARIKAENEAAEDALPVSLDEIFTEEASDDESREEVDEDEFHAGEEFREGEEHERMEASRKSGGNRQALLAASLKAFGKKRKV